MSCTSDIVRSVSKVHHGVNTSERNEKYNRIAEEECRGVRHVKNEIKYVMLKHNRVQLTSKSIAKIEYQARNQTQYFVRQVVSRNFDYKSCNYKQNLKVYFKEYNHSSFLLHFPSHWRTSNTLQYDVNTHLF